MRIFSGRLTPGLRRPPEPARQRATFEEAVQVLRHVQPWAAPRLPDEVLACFDGLQRKIRPLPGEVPDRGRR